MDQILTSHRNIPPAWTRCSPVTSFTQRSQEQNHATSETTSSRSRSSISLDCRYQVLVGTMSIPSRTPNRGESTSSNSINREDSSQIDVSANAAAISLMEVTSVDQAKEVKTVGQFLRRRVLVAHRVHRNTHSLRRQKYTAHTQTLRDKHLSLFLNSRRRLGS